MELNIDGKKKTSKCFIAESLLCIHFADLRSTATIMQDHEEWFQMSSSSVDSDVNG